jgi:hypothetical protein
MRSEVERFYARTGERNLKIGTVLVRDYQGRRHTVTVEPNGYVWEGNPYSSLSAIARAITGTAWSFNIMAFLSDGVPIKFVHARRGCSISVRLMGRPRTLSKA